MKANGRICLLFIHSLLRSLFFWPRRSIPLYHLYHLICVRFGEIFAEPNGWLEQNPSIRFYRSLSFVVKKSVQLFFLSLSLLSA